MKIAFIHPDLGIGGAERLVVDAAVGLQSLGHEVIVHTSHHDKSHCFDETKDGTLKVVVEGNSVVPTKIAGRFAILCAILRQIHLCVELTNRPDADSYDVIIVDQLSTCIPLLRLNLRGRILFYGHFPDQLLTQRTSLIKKLYRIPFDWLEAWTTRMADVIVVNSKFTQSVFEKTIPGINRVPDVVYPGVDTKQAANLVVDKDLLSQISRRNVVLSINRFERKKNIELALRSFAAAVQSHASDKTAVLFVTGGYDPRVAENIEYLADLQHLSDTLKLANTTLFPKDKYEIPATSQVVFLPSISGITKNTLLKASRLLLYTPSNEHFGIVPIEAMMAGVPPLATDNGGPLETIADGTTGWNRPSDVSEWAKVVTRVLYEMTPEEHAKMADAAKTRVEQKFSVENMVKEFEAEAQRTIEVERQDVSELDRVVTWVKAILVTMFVILIVMLFKMLQPQK